MAKTQTPRCTSADSATKTPKGKDCYSVYINYLWEAFNTNNFLRCKETLELFAFVKGLTLETNLFASNEEMDLDRFHDFLSEVVSRKQANTARQAPMDFKERTNLMEKQNKCILQTDKDCASFQQHHHH